VAIKVDKKIYERILYLKNQGLTNAVIAERLGLSSRTVRVFTRAARTGTKPYHPDEKDE
jgi:DNA-binding CsgD family transcriptional regulator